MTHPEKAPDIVITEASLSSSQDEKPEIGGEKLVVRGDLPPVTSEMVEQADKAVLNGGLTPDASPEYREKVVNEARERQLARDVGSAVDEIRLKREQQ